MKFSLIKIFGFILTAFLIAAPAFGAEDNSIELSLPQALDIALARHVDVIIANERVDQALARIQENSSPLLPQLKATVSETRQTRDIRSTGLPVSSNPLLGPFNVYDARIKLTQTIFDPGAFTRFKASQQDHALSLAQQKKVQNDVLVLVATLFIDAKRAQDSLSVYQSLLRRDKKELAITFSRTQTGLSSSLDLKKARATYARSLSLFESAKKEALERKLDLAAALDLPLYQPIVFIWDDQLILKTVVDMTVSDDQPDVKVAYQQLKVNEKQRNANQWDFWPKISVSGDYGPSGDSPSTEDSSETYTMGISASFPIFEGGLRQAKYKESVNEVRISQEQLGRVQRDVNAKVSTQQGIVLQALASLQDNEEALALAQEELKVVQTKFNLGNGSPLDLASAEVNLKFALDNKEEARAYYLLSKINLARSLGQIEQFLEK